MDTLLCESYKGFIESLGLVISIHPLRETKGLNPQRIFPLLTREANPSTLNGRVQSFLEPSVICTSDLHPPSIRCAMERCSPCHLAHNLKLYWAHRIGVIATCFWIENCPWCNTYPGKMPHNANTTYTFTKQYRFNWLIIKMNALGPNHPETLTNQEGWQMEMQSKTLRKSPQCCEWCWEQLFNKFNSRKTSFPWGSLLNIPISFVSSHKLLREIFEKRSRPIQ